MPTINVTITPEQAARVQPVLDKHQMTAEEFIKNLLGRVVRGYEREEQERNITDQAF